MQKFGEKIGKQKLGIQDKKIQDKFFLNKKYQENKSEKINKILSLIKRASRGGKDRKGNVRTGGDMALVMQRMIVLGVYDS